MIKVMLEAVSDMLKPGGEDFKEFRTRVSCAKTILDKVIEGLPKEEGIVQIPSVFAPDIKVPQSVTESTSKPELKGPVDGKYKIVKDDNNKLVKIEGLPLDAKVELDGKVMTHMQARGTKFISGRIL